jgi:hypothetical protein
MNFPWFKRIGMFYIPRNLAGWFIMIAAIIFAVYRFIEIDSRSHSASDTLRPFIINLIIIFFAYTLIAFLTSSISKNKKKLSE